MLNSRRVLVLYARPMTPAQRRRAKHKRRSQHEHPPGCPRCFHAASARHGAGDTAWRQPQGSLMDALRKMAGR